MPVPNYSFVLSAQLLGSTAVAVGDVLIPNEAVTAFQVASAANRGSRRSEGVALTAYSGTSVGGVQMQQAGVIDATISGLATAGSRQLVRASSAGRIERVSGFSPGDDIIGYAEQNGRVHLHFGIPWDLITGTASIGPTIVNSDTGQLDDIASDEGGTAAAVIVFTGDDHVDLTSIQGGTESREIILVNLLTIEDSPIGILTLINDTGTAANRISFSDENTITVPSLGATKIVYDVTTSRWRVVGSVGGSDLPAPGTAGNVLTSDGDEWTSSALPNLPAGSGTEYQYRSSATAFGASTSLQYDGSLGAPWAKPLLLLGNGGGSFRGSLFPTTLGADRTWTLPDASTQLLGDDNTRTVTNKTVNLTNNTVTDTSTAAGDLAKSNGTKFVRFARGTSLQYLRVNSGGTDLEWATLSAGGSPGSPDKSLQYRVDGSTFGGETHWTREATGRINVTDSGFVTYGAAGSTYPSEAFVRVENIVSEGGPIAVIAGRHDGTDSVGLYSTDSGWQLSGGIDLNIDVQQTSFISGWGVTFEDGFLSNALITVGGTSSVDTDNVSSASFRSTASDIATTGVLRCANNTAMVAVRNAINSVDAEVLKVAAGGAETLSFWTTNAAFGDITIKTPNLQKVSFEDASIWRMLITPTGIECALPLGGSQTASKPFRWRQTSIAISGNTTPTAAQYQCPNILLTGSPGAGFDLTMPDETGAMFAIKNGTTQTATVKKSGGSGTTIATTVRRYVIYGTSDYEIWPS